MSPVVTVSWGGGIRWFSAEAGPSSTPTNHTPVPPSHILTGPYILRAWVIDILLGVRWYLTVVSVRVSLIPNHVQHLVTCLLAIYASLKKEL